MKHLHTSAAAAVIAAAPLAAPAQDAPALTDLLATDALTRIALNVGVLILRSQVDITYDGISVSRGGAEISLAGVKLYPLPEWDPQGLCEIAIARLDLSLAGGPGYSEVHAEAVGTEIGQDCLPPEAREPMMATGYDGIGVDRLYADLAYDVGSSALDLAAHLAVREAAVVDVAARFDYFWFRDTGYGDPEPALLLASAAVSIEDRGLLDRVRPIVPPDEFNFDLAPQIVTQGLIQAIGEGGQQPLDAAEMAFASTAGEAVGAFLNGAGRITVTVRPETPVWLGPASFDTPGDAIATLAPRIATGPGAGAPEMIAPDLLEAALSGAPLDPADARRVGLALLDGVGAPRAPHAGQDVLEPLAADDPEVALALARSLAGEDPEAAYRFALDATAAGLDGSLGVLDGVETALPAAAILGLQGEDRSGAIDVATGAGDLRDAALAAMLGLGQRRSYADAYVLAALAAAAGDPSSAGLRERIDRRLADHDDDGSWARARTALDGEVLGAWIGILGPRFAETGGDTDGGTTDGGFSGWGNSGN